MIETIELWESKGFRICITPMQDKSTWAWIAGVYIGKKFGTKLGCKAEILGGIILITIGLEIFISGIFFK